MGDRGGTQDSDVAILINDRPCDHRAEYTEVPGWFIV